MMLTGWNVPWAQVIFRSFGENNWSEHDGQFIFWALTWHQDPTVPAGHSSWVKLGRKGVDVKVVGPVSFLAYVEVKKVEYMLVLIHESMAVVKVFCSVCMSI